MVSVASLLNPVLQDSQPLPSPVSTSRFTSEPSPAPSPPPVKKQKMTKDGAVFSRAPVKGLIRYPPVESYDAKIMAELQKFSVYPLGRISEYRRHIPYNSEKKNFLERTGRGALEVFQYTFQLPGQDRQFVVMWDYNIGLVRITPFFKCCEYAKTVPAKMLNSNPGLREIAHSITGGAIAAQGYWLPFEAARAMTANFAYTIRYALVPLFGPKFVTMCLKPGSDGFGQMTIDPSIIIKCTQDAKDYKDMSIEERSQTSSNGSGGSRPTTSTWSTSSHRGGFRAVNHVDEQYAHGVSSELYPPSPQLTHDWRASHTPRPKLLAMKLPSPREILGSRGRLSRVPASNNFDASPTSPGSSSSAVSPKTSPKVKRKRVREGQDKSQLAPVSHDLIASSGSPLTSTKETRAAYQLMQLHFADTTLKDGVSMAKKRRASS